MAHPAEAIRSEGEPVAPAADPASIRACPTPVLVAEFDREDVKALIRERQAD